MDSKEENNLINTYNHSKLRQLVLEFGKKELISTGRYNSLELEYYDGIIDEIYNILYSPINDSLKFQKLVLMKQEHEIMKGPPTSQYERGVLDNALKEFILPTLENFSAIIQNV
jgi:hypothetical protein